jgi:hypothetical protein
MSDLLSGIALICGPIPQRDFTVPPCWRSPWCPEPGDCVVSSFLGVNDNEKTYFTVARGLFVDCRDIAGKRNAHKFHN